MARISWHPAFVQAIQLELEDYRDVLTFETEHQLTTEPLKIDVLIIKKTKDVVVKKNIGQIFRQLNIVEYKSPTDRATIADYDKTQCYSRLYASLNKKYVADMSVTIVATRHPKKLLKYLNKQYKVTHAQPGIYLVEGDTSPTQIIVSEELSEKGNLWLNSLRNDLTVARLKQVGSSKETTLPMDAYFQVVIEANIAMMEELEMQRKKGYIFSEKLDMLLNERIGIPAEARGKAEGKTEAVLTFLRARFNRVPEGIEKTIRSVSDPAALDSWIAQAATCQSLDEFAEAVK